MADTTSGGDTSPGVEEPTAGEEEEFDRLFGIVADGIIGAAGGLVGTAAMTGVLFIAGQAGAFEFEAFASLTQPIGLDAVGPPVTIGYLIFLANGMVPWPLLFASIKEYLPGGRDPVRGVVFGTILWTGFVFAFFRGFTGTTLVVYLVLTLVAHWVYGFSLGRVFEYLATRPDSLV